MENSLMYTVVPQADCATPEGLTDKLLCSPGVRAATVSKSEGRVYVRGMGINEQVIAQLIAQSGYEVIASNFR